jgi:nucleolar MIF4G domain-containing protein 1
VLHISLLDFLQADTRGRWWRAGASWGGRTSQAKDAAREKEKQQQQRSGVSQGGVGGRSAANTPDEEKQLLKVARKLGMNTDIRKNIFLVVMSSRDETDAFERLARLGLRGKQDREVVRVVAECCGSEKLYNQFYSELAALFCVQNRQYKITLQYAYWDLFKTLCEEDPAVSKKKLDRRAINMARMLAHLTINFHMSLSVLKVIDIADISSSMLLFLATYFMSLFSAKVSKRR